MLSNAYFLAKNCFDTAENEPAKNLQNFAEEIANFANVANFAKDLLSEVSDGEVSVRFGRLSEVSEPLRRLSLRLSDRLSGLSDVSSVCVPRRDCFQGIPALQ